MPKRRLRNEVEQSDRRLRPRTSRPRSNTSRGSNDDLAVPGCNLPELSTELADVLQRAHRQLVQEVRSLAYDLHSSRYHRSQEGFPFMKLPPELRIMIWHLAAESHIRATFEIIQPPVLLSSFPPAHSMDGNPFRIRCPPSRRLVAQACREAQATLQPNPRHKFTTPIQTCLDGQRDHLVIPAKLRVPRAIGHRDVLGPARHIIIKHEQPYDMYYEGAMKFINSLLLIVVAGGITMDSLSFIVGQFKVTAPFQALLEMELQSQFPLVINIDDESEVNRVSRVFEGRPDSWIGFPAAIESLQQRSPGGWGELWHDFKAKIRRRVLKGSGWDDELIESLVTERRVSARRYTRYSEAYNRLPEFKRVVMVHSYWEGPEHAHVIGPSLSDGWDYGDGWLKLN
ncbi:hypothetical protein CHU98_g10576 [Xylaria longipes]|nr:hypothetical protein CHU98_g10576 [Xylaria longipes]